MPITPSDRQQIQDAIGLLLGSLDNAETAHVFFASDVENGKYRPLEQYQSYAPGDFLMFSFVVRKGKRRGNQRT